MTKILPLIFTLFFICTKSHSQQYRWQELGKDSVSSNCYKYSNFCKDQAGNMYAGMTRDVYKWNEATFSWNELGSGVNSLRATLAVSAVNCIAADGLGNIYAAGTMNNAKGKLCVAKWNGIRWSILDNDTTSFNVTSNYGIISMAADKKGFVYVAGSYNGAPYGISKWDGISWTKLTLSATPGSYSATSDIQKMLTDSSDNLYACGGQFVNGDSSCYLIKWNGSVWNQCGGKNNNAPSYIRTMCIDKDNNIYGVVQVYSSNKYFVTKWNGASWTSVGNIAPMLKESDRIMAITADKTNNIYVGGTFVNQKGKQYVAKWDGYIWSAAEDSINP